MIQSSGYQSAFLWFGLGQGIVVVLVALFLRAPEPGEVNAPAAPAVAQSKRDYGPGEVLRTPVFWVMYVMFVMVGAGGLMATAQLAPIAKDFNVGGIPVSILGITLPALTFALSIDRVLNGFCRPFFGWVSDNIGRENTMFIAFFAEGIGIYALYLNANDPLLFVLLSGVVFFAWGEIYSLFPATSTDIYGRKFATTNYGLLYTAFTDGEGRYRFRTILPALYPGRTRHYHVKVQAPERPVLTTQLYLPDEPTNRRDRPESW